MKIKLKHIVRATLIAAWLGGASVATPLLAGGMYLAVGKRDPSLVTSTTWSDNWAIYSQSDKVQRKRLQGTMGVALVLLFGLPLAAILASLNKRRSLHGDARWARRDEIEEAGLLGSKGIILGKFQGRYLMCDDARFVMLNAPTRSGKGVGMVVPNLLNWPGSVIATDLKGELFEITSGFRAKHGQAVFRFAPFDENFRTHRVNPLSYVSRDPRFAVGHLTSVAYMIYPGGGDGTTSFFNDQARNLFVALGLYCMESGIPLTIGELLRQSSGGGKPKEHWSGVVASQKGANGADLSKGCVDALAQFVGTSDNTLSSILATFNAPLGIFSNPTVDAATSGDDFDLRELRRKLITIYITVPPGRLAEGGRLLNLIFSVALDQNTMVMPEHDPSLKHLLLLVLDEFPAMGRMEKLAKSVAFVAGYGIRLITISQSMSQLKASDMYGKEGAETLANNHLVQVLYQPSNNGDAREYSETLGYATEKGISRGHSSGRGSPPTRSENVSDQKRALMLPQELRHMGFDAAVVIPDNCLPIYADKIRYYDDPVFKKRLLPPISVGLSVVNPPAVLAGVGPSASVVSPQAVLAGVGLGVSAVNPSAALAGVGPGVSLVNPQAALARRDGRIREVAPGEVPAMHDIVSTVSFDSLPGPKSVNDQNSVLLVQHFLGAYGVNWEARSTLDALIARVATTPAASASAAAPVDFEEAE